MSLPKVLTPVESETIVTQVYHTLRAAIHRGQLKPGQRLMDGELAEALQVSRATVREALCLLQSKGLVVNKHRRGAFVAELTPDDVRDIYSFRILLETYAVRVGARTATVAQLDRLQRLIDELDDAARRQDFERIVDLDLRFHQVICEFASSQRLLEAWLSMETVLRAFLLLKYDLYDDSPLIAGSHQPLVDALRARDGETAAAVLHDHIAETAEKILKSLAREEQRLLEMAPPP